jgi:hypothetical protein
VQNYILPLGNVYPSAPKETQREGASKSQRFFNESNFFPTQAVANNKKLGKKQKS